MKSVKLIFANSRYNYTTAVNPKTSDEANRKYFVGQLFNVGAYPTENIQTCINIEILKDEK